VEPGESMAAAWLPRVAVIVAAALLIWAVISYW